MRYTNLKLLFLMILNPTGSGFINPKPKLREPLKMQSKNLFETTQETLSFDFDMLEHDLKRTVGKEVVLQISSVLPKVDTIGHDILHANNQFVVDILGNENMSHEFKKELILLSIRLAQYGDDLGSFFLQQYYNIVHNII